MEYRGRSTADKANVRRLANILTFAKVTSSADLKLAASIMDKTVEESCEQGQNPKRICAKLGGFPVAVTKTGVSCLSVHDAETFKIDPSQRQYITLQLLKLAGGLFLTNKDASEVEKATSEFAEQPSAAFSKICRVFWAAASRKNVAISLSLVISFTLAYIALRANNGGMPGTLSVITSLFSRLESARKGAGTSLSNFMEGLSSWMSPNVEQLLKTLQSARDSSDAAFRKVVQNLNDTEKERRAAERDMNTLSVAIAKLKDQASDVENAARYNNTTKLLTGILGGGIITGLLTGDDKPPQRKLLKQKAGKH